MYCCVNLFEKSPTNMYFLSFVSLWTIIAFFGISGGTKFTNFFICNERGHLSKTCPQNTHGIYPKVY